MRNEVSEVKEKTDIVQIVAEHVSLKKAGRHFLGLCPFHSEKTPSFTVSPELQMYKCFGCGKSGDVFTFLQEFEGLEFPDALKILAERANVTLTPFKGENSSHKDVLFEINDVSSKYYHYVLLNLSPAKPYLSYLLEKRGLSLDTIKTFGIGASPEGNPHALFDFLVKKKGYKPDLLVEAGLVFKTDRGQYLDRFRGRIIFPIQNARGGVVALSGRILPTLPKAQSLAKYINSPETPIYKKSESLFGIFHAREAIKRSGIAIVTEGELDMISPYQAGIKNIVAIKGSALTDSHARILSRLSKTIILALDSDFAGNSAAIKGISEAQNYGLSVRVLNLLNYKDPDEFAKADLKGFKKALEDATDAWEFVIGVFFKRFNADTVEGKAAISKELIPFLGFIDDPILRAHYIRLVATRLSVPESAVEKALSVSIQKKGAPQVIFTEENKVPHNDRRAILEERLFTVGIFVDPKKLVSVYKNNYIQTAKIKKLANFLSEFIVKNTFSMKSFLEFLPIEFREIFLKIALLETGEDRNLSKEFKDLVTELKELSLKEEIAGLTAEIKILDTNDEFAKVSAIQSKIGELTSMLAKLKQE